MIARDSAALECCRQLLAVVDLDAVQSKSYLASSALQSFLGGPKAGYSLVKATNGAGDHYWVVTGDGVILDPTKESGERLSYKDGRKISRRNTLMGHLPLLEAMQEAFKDDDYVNGSRPTLDVFGRPLVVSKDDVLSEDQQAKLSAAWYSLAYDWAERPEEFIRSTFPKGALAVYFVRALLYGEEIPRTATMAYTWDRYYVAGSAYPFNEMLPAALENPGTLRGMRFALADEISFSKLIASNLPIQGYRIPADFPIGLAKKLINKYCPKNGRILDPCHGWGGRMVGFMLSHAATYTGIDPAPHGHKLREMFDDLSMYLDQPKQIKLVNKPFEDVTLSQAVYDFAITSPPYWNTEKYQGDQSSWRRYKTLDQWIDGFYRSLLAGVADALKPGAWLALQVTPKFDLVKEAKRIGKDVGLKFDGVADTTMRRYNSASADKMGSTELFEVVAIFRKQK